MPATIIDGRTAAARVLEQVAREVAELVERTGRRPGLATVLVGDDPASEVYVANKRKLSVEVGIVDHHRHLDSDATQAEVAAAIEQLGDDPDVSGILLQLPVPDGLDGRALTALIAPEKDVDGLTPLSAGRLAQGTPGLRPCTPLGILELLDSHQVELQGAEAVIVGRSQLVGKPLAALLLQRHATSRCATRAHASLPPCARAPTCWWRPSAARG
jgi:methylenetetrahydrofolate dehydrogenase (NADP+)/methenyltetrahydrofolate cyclohydrolase